MMTVEYLNLLLIITKSITNNTTIIGIFAVWFPTFFVISSKDYYYIDDNGNKNKIDVAYKYSYIISSLIAFSLMPFIVISTAETTIEFNNFISKQNSDVIRFSTYITEHGHVGLSKMIFSDVNDLKLGFLVATNECLLRYALIFAMDLNISVSIDWKYVILSILLRGLGVSLVIAVLFKYRLTFVFDNGGEPLLLLLIFVAAVVIHTSSITIEDAFLVSTSSDGVGSMACSSYTISSAGLAVLLLIVERSVVFVIYNLCSIPSVLSWKGLKEAETRCQEANDKFMGEAAITKVLYNL